MGPEDTANKPPMGRRSVFGALGAAASAVSGVVGEVISAASSPRKAAPREGTPKAVEPPQHSSTPLEKAQEYVNGLEPAERRTDPAASIGDEEERRGEGERVEEEHVGEVVPIRIGDEGSEEEEE